MTGPDATVIVEERWFRKIDQFYRDGEKNDGGRNLILDWELQAVTWRFVRISASPYTFFLYKDR